MRQDAFRKVARGIALALAATAGGRIRTGPAARGLAPANEWG